MNPGRTLSRWGTLLTVSRSPPSASHPYQQEVPTTPISHTRGQRPAPSLTLPSLSLCWLCVSPGGRTF